MSADRKQPPSRSSGFIVSKAKELSRRERRQGNAAAKKGVEKTDNPRVRQRAEWYN